MKEYSDITRSLVELNTLQMGPSIKVSSKITICMVEAVFSIQMEQCILVPLKIMKSMD
jgi:hypothetical protein